MNVFQLYLIVLVRFTVVHSLDVAIIGGGIGGSSLSFFLANLPDVKIDVFDRQPADKSGRVRNFAYTNKKYELGGTLIHDQNVLLVNFTKQFNLKLHKNDEARSGGTILFNPKEPTKSVQLFDTIASKLKAFWRYGSDLFWIQRQVSALIDEFIHIYDVIGAGFSFSSAGRLSDALHPPLNTMGKSYTASFLLNNGYGIDLVNEVARAACRGTYFQDVTIHSLVGFVALAGVQGDRIYSVTGGNNQIIRNLLEQSKSSLHFNSEVKTIRKDSKKWSIVLAENTSKTFDVVVIAAPLVYGQQSFLKLQGVEEKVLDRYQTLYQRFHMVVVTFVQGKLNATTFFNSDFDQVCNVGHNTDDIWFFALNRPLTVDGELEVLENGDFVYKVMSPKKLTRLQLDTLFSRSNNVVSHTWLALPKYDSVMSTNTDFIIDDNLYYLNSYEAAFSAMEMASLAAKNVANIISSKIHSKEHLIDSRQSFNRPIDHSEL